MNEAQAWAVLDGVPDPELPSLSLRDLGIVREVAVAGGRVRVVLTPTYSGCPATEVIADSVRAAFAAAGCAEVDLQQRLAPAWTSDWISEAGRAKLLASGTVPPGPAAGARAAALERPLRLRPRNLACPRCASLDTERLSAFGATACKALHRCRACGEPFEHFKAL